MNFNDYQERAKATCKPQSYRLDYLVLGLNGEAGEVAEKVKKVIRDKHGKMDREKEIEIIKELGDVLWYLTVTASYLGFKLEDVAKINIDKLEDRKRRNKISGDGDNR